jgi:nicotinamidase-related amidase
MHTALILIDVQESFRQRPYWVEKDAQPFLTECNALVAACIAQKVPVVRILHSDGPAEASNPFAMESGHVRPLDGLMPFAHAAQFLKHRHSALVGTGLSVWLHENRIHRLIVAGIRTEQCVETTTRHASDEGWEVDYCAEATLTFDMQHLDGSVLRASDITARTTAVLSGRFATICTAGDALVRAR